MVLRPLGHPATAVARIAARRVPDLLSCVSLRRIETVPGRDSSPLMTGRPPASLGGVVAGASDIEPVRIRTWTVAGAQADARPAVGRQSSPPDAIPGARRRATSARGRPGS